MKIVCAIVRPEAVHRILSALHECKHFPGLTISPCEGQSRGRGPGGRYVATEESLDSKAMRRIEIFCNDEVSEHLVKVILDAGHTGNAGDGVIVVHEAARIIRIRTGQEQNDAV